MSDVSAAFDKVITSRMVAKLEARGAPEYVRRILSSWLRARYAEVVVGGSRSTKMLLQNMVFQGTVWGPMLWNVFYGDASKAIRKKSFTEIVFADDLNAFKRYDSKVETDTILKEMEACQNELHEWGKANQVTFDAKKESQHILSRKRPYGSSFKLLGVQFDCKLLMIDTVFELVKDCRWKLNAVLRTKRFNNGLQLMTLYKAQLLSYIEYRTAAIYHACQHSLDALERVQGRLLEAVGMTEVEALTVCRLAPLSARRDMALLGLIHRTVLGRGPSHFATFFRPDHNARKDHGARHRLQLAEQATGHVRDFMFPGSRPAVYLKHSMFGLISVYNRLPATVVENAGCVSSFQSALQTMLADQATSGVANWAQTFSPRVPWHRHPLTIACEKGGQG